MTKKSLVIALLFALVALPGLTWAKTPADLNDLEIAHVAYTADSIDISAHAHASGKRLDLAAHAVTQDVRKAGEIALEKLQRELRREHDKRIFARRREARRDQERRRTA